MQTLFAILRDWGWEIFVAGLLLLAGDLVWQWKKGKLSIAEIMSSCTLGIVFGYMVWLIQNIPTSRVEIAIHCYVSYVLIMSISIIATTCVVSILNRKKLPYWKQIYYAIALGILMLCRYRSVLGGFSE